MTGYRFELHCPDCDTELDHREIDAIDADTNVSRSADAWCPTCLAIFRVDVVLRPIEQMADLFQPSDASRRTRAADAAGIY